MCRAESGSQAGPRPQPDIDGVTWLAKKQQWRAHLRAHGKRRVLGYFPTQQAALQALQQVYFSYVPPIFVTTTSHIVCMMLLDFIDFFGSLRVYSICSDFHRLPNTILGCMSDCKFHSHDSAALTLLFTAAPGVVCIAV